MIIYHLGGEDLERIKSQVLELVVAMVGTAVAAGGAPHDLLGAQYRSLQELGRIADEEALAEWLTGMLGRIMDAMLERAPDDDPVRLKAGLAYIRRHHAQPIRRADAAAAACCSPSHFARLLRERIGRSFTDLLNQARVDEASARLQRTDDEIIIIALDTGFSDQSYFTKVFSRYTGMTPKAYRKRWRVARSPR